MKTSKMYFAALVLIFTFFSLQAQVINPDARKWGENPEAIYSASNFTDDFYSINQEDTHTLLDKVKTIYTALEEGDPNTITALVATDITWNGNDGLPFSDGNPHIGSSVLLEMAFNRIGELWTNCMLYDLTYQVSPNQSITVKGSYQAYHDKKLEISDFVHVWMVKKGEIVSFQHYENVPYVANR